MLRLALRSLLARKLRLLLSALAVVLGVAFVSGTLVLTDTMNATFDHLFGQVERNTSAVVREQAHLSGGEGISRKAVPESTLAAVRRVPGVAEATGDVSGYAQLVVNGSVVKTGGAPSLGNSWSGSDQLSTVQLVSGRRPHGVHEIAVDVTTAKNHGLHVGQSVQVLLNGPPEQATITGLARLGSTGNLAGASLVLFDLPSAQQVLGEPGQFDLIRVRSDGSMSDTALAQRLASALPAGTDVLTGQQYADEQAKQTGAFIGTFRTFLLVFAGIALFVGAFIIANTFAMLLAQRLRELALLRALGASRRQVISIVLAEAAAVGVVGGTVGLGLGALVAGGLRALIESFGGKLPSTSLVFAGHTIFAAYAVGIGVTVLAALAPARRSSSVPPVAAMRESVVLPEQSIRRRTIGGSIVAVAGVVLLLVGLAGSGTTALSLVGVGAALVFLGVRLLSPLISRPVISVLGAPFRGAIGRLGTANARRDPRRSAATASALMIGLALVTSFGVVGSSLTKSFHAIFADSLRADWIVSAEGGNQGFSPQVVDKLRQLPGIGAVSGVETGPAEVSGGAVQVSALDPRSGPKLLVLAVQHGSLSALPGGQLLVSEKAATAKGYRVGESVPVRFAATGTQHMTVGAIFHTNTLAGDYVVSSRVLAANVPHVFETVVLASGSSGAASITGALHDYPNLKVQTQAQYLDDAEKNLNQVLTFVDVLLVFAVLIAVLGIVNTLALSIIERQREIGMLRAVGMSRRQLRSMVRVESVVISVYGAVLGLAVGVFLGWALTNTMKTQGIDRVGFPIRTILAEFVLAGVLGVLAAVLPARRAAKTNVLEAIATA